MNLSKNRLKWLIAILIIISTANTPKGSFITGFLMDERHFYGSSDFVYSSGQGGFTTKGVYMSNYQDVLVQFNKYRLINPSDSILYRNFSINPFKFWFWREYLTEDMYDLPYKPAQ